MHLRIACSKSRSFHAFITQYKNVEHDTTGPDYHPFATKSLRQIGSTDTYRVVLSEAGHEKDVRNDKPKIQNPIWKPTTAQGVHDLAALVDAIKALAVQSKPVNVEHQEDAEDEGSTKEVVDEEGGLPLSPLEILSGAHKRKRKRRPTKEELAELRSNPWAKMLAASVRQCMATRTRFPASLLLDIGQVVNPNDLEIYLMPDAMADLQEFNKRLQSGKMSKAISLKSGRGDKLKMLPYKLIFEKLTDTFMAYDSKSKQSRTRSGAVSKALFPGRWVQNTEKVSAYNNASKEYYNIAEKQGLEGEIHQRPKPLFDAEKVLWQPAIVERIPNIMRQRILLCLKRLADIDSKYNDGSLKHLYRFEWPADAELDLSIVDQALDTTRDFWNDMGDIEAEGAISGDSHEQGARVDGRAPITVQPWELDTQATQPQSGHHTWIQGSFLLHLGPASIPNQYISTASDDTSSDFTETPPHSPSPPAQHSKFIPPMMTIGTYRLPVFNLYAMFGTQFIEVLSRLLTTYSIFRPDSAVVDNTTTTTPTTHDTSSDQTTHHDPVPTHLNPNTNFLVLVKSTAPCAHFLVQELWQLWRYLGGTDCFINSSSQEEIPSETRQRPRQTKVDMTHNMSPQAWNQLYQMLDMRRSDEKTQASVEGVQKNSSPLPGDVGEVHDDKGGAG